ncbi:MAG: hypothetical protein Q9160_001756 [Pyrenula sp. 1 TL-2023]
MTSDDQQFLDLLASIPQDAASYGARYASAVAEYVEKQSDSLATTIRDNVNVEIFSYLIPEFLRPEPAQRVPTFFSRAPPPPPQSLFGKVCAWVSENRTIIACTLAFSGTTFYLINRQRKNHVRKRRARRGPNGAKKEVVVLATTFHDPLARSVAFDLDRRGFIVYITVNSHEEEQQVHSENKPDIQPLWIDLTSTTPNQGTDIHPNFLPIYNLIKPRRISSSAVNSNPVSLSGLIILPSTTYPPGILSTLPPSDILDTVNTHLISPMLILQQYLPLHYASTNFHPHKIPPRVVLAAPSIASSLPTATSPLESALPTTLRSLLPSLRQELASSTAPNTSVIDIRLGNFDLLPKTSRRTRSIPHSPPSRSRSTLSPSPSRTHPHPQLALPWHSSHFPSLSPLPSRNSNIWTRGSPLRDLHNAIFDALTPPHPAHIALSLPTFGLSSSQPHTLKIPVGLPRSEVVYAGRGAWIYGLVGRLVPWGASASMWGKGRRGAGLRGGDGEVSGDGLSDVGEGHSDEFAGSWRDGVADGEGETEPETAISGESEIWEKVRGGESE